MENKMKLLTKHIEVKFDRKFTEEKCSCFYFAGSDCAFEEMANGHAMDCKLCELLFDTDRMIKSQEDLDEWILDITGE